MAKTSTKKVYFVEGIGGGGFFSPEQIKALRPSKSGYRPAQIATKALNNTFASAKYMSAAQKAKLASAPTILSITAGENCESCAKKRKRNGNK